MGSIILFFVEIPKGLGVCVGYHIVDFAGYTFAL